MAIGRDRPEGEEEVRTVDGVPGPDELAWIAKLAARFGVRRVAMMLAGPHLRVVPVTTHLPLSRVSSALSADGIARAASLTIQTLAEDFGIVRPRVAIAALNPHAGEGAIGHA